MFMKGVRKILGKREFFYDVILSYSSKIFANRKQQQTYILCVQKKVPQVALFHER